MSLFNTKAGMMKKIIISMIIVVMVAATVTPYAALETRAQGEGGYMENPFDYDAVLDFDLHISPFYYEVLQKWQEEGIPEGTEEIYVPADSVSRQADDADIEIGHYKGRDGVLIWRNQRGWIEFDVEVSNEGLYEMSLDYYPLPASEGGGRSPILVNTVINGEMQFRESRSSFPRLWQDVWPLSLNEYGDEVRPQLVELEGWKTERFKDYEGGYTRPLQYHFEEGTNTIRIDLNQEMFAISGLSLHPPGHIPTYEEVAAEYTQVYPDVEPIRIGAQQMEMKNNTAVGVEFNRDGYSRPESYRAIRYNAMGGWRWFRGGHAATWKIDVPEDGLYKLGLRAQNNYQANLSVFRTIKINGETPFTELEAYQFPYSSRFYGETLSNAQDDPYLFYLEAGENFITMETNFNPYIPVIVLIDHISSQLRDITMDLMAATGGQDDTSRDWNVEQDLPELLPELRSIREELVEAHELMLEINGERSNVSQTINSAITDVDRFLKRPNRIPGQQESVGAMYEKLENQRQALLDQPLLLESIFLVPADQDMPRMEATFMERMKASFYTFTSSFIDRHQLGDSTDDELNVWVMWGQDYVNELIQLTEEYFIPQQTNNIPVRLTLINQPQLLILANAAGIMPDVAIGFPGELAYDLALRGAVQNLSLLEGSDEVFERYHPGALLPFWYDDGENPGYYGIPETMQFKVMFYRIDIMNELGLSIPNTWDDVYEMLPTLLQNNYNFFKEPRDFSVFFYQRGLELYPEDGFTTGLNSPEAHEMFREWTDLFNVYGLERFVQSFYNQFRRGYLPIGLADFNQYMQLLVGAPELRGFWGIAPIPGIEDEDGNIVRWSGGVPDLQGASSLASTAKIEGSAMTTVKLFNRTPEHLQKMAWDYARWYVSTETQTAFGLNLEQYHGEEFRWASANVAAFANMPWFPEDLDVLLYQWQWFKDFPNVPGGYMTGRELNFAWIRTVIENVTARESLEIAIRNINSELYRKQIEFGMIDSETGQYLRESLNVPHVTKPWEGVSKYVR